MFRKGDIVTLDKNNVTNSELGVVLEIIESRPHIQTLAVK